MDNGTKNQAKLVFGILSLAFISQINTIASVIMADIAANFPDASQTAIQYVMQMGMIGGFPAELAVGFMAKKLRIKSILLAGVLFILIGGMVPVLKHDSIPVLYACAFIVGAGQGFLLPLIGTLILLNFEEKKRDRLLGLNMTFGTGGATVFLLLAGPVALSGWVNTFFLYGIALAAFFAAAICLPKGEAAPPPSRDAETKAPVPVTALIQCGISVLMFICYVSFPLNIAMYASAEGIGNAAVVAGVSMSIVTVAGALLGFVFQPLVRTFKLFIGLFAAIAGFLGMLLVCLIPGIAAVYAASALLGLFFGTQMAAGGYIISRICKPEQIAPSFSIIQCAITLGVILSPIVINVVTSLWGGTGSKGSFITSAAVFGIVVVLQAFWSAWLTRTCSGLSDEQIPAAA